MNWPPLTRNFSEPLARIAGLALPLFQELIVLLEHVVKLPKLSVYGGITELATEVDDALKARGVHRGSAEFANRDLRQRAG